MVLRCVPGELQEGMIRITTPDWLQSDPSKKLLHVSVSLVGATLPVWCGLKE